MRKRKKKCRDATTSHPIEITYFTFFVLLILQSGRKKCPRKASAIFIVQQLFYMRNSQSTQLEVFIQKRSTFRAQHQQISTEAKEAKQTEFEKKKCTTKQ